VPRSTPRQQPKAFRRVQAASQRLRLRRPGRRAAAILAALLTPVAGLSLAAPAGATVVRVQPGQNLTQIARTYGTTVSALVAANNITNPNMVVIGTPLSLPSSTSTSAGTTQSVPSTGTTVVAQSGDSLWSIATRNGISPTALAQANGMTLSSTVLIGMSLKVPAATAAIAAASARGYPSGLAANASRLALQPIFEQWAAHFGVPVSLVEGTCWWESGWQMGVVSSTGAVGIGQLEPSTVSTLRTELGDQSLSATDPSDNIEMSAAYLHQLLSETGGNQSQAIASYYQGFASVTQSGMLPSTVQYVQGVEASVALFS
jgi:LysM repeat protein